jgi:hypothetical protein
MVAVEPRQPTVSELQRRLGCARSTAWHHQQRRLRLLSRVYARPTPEDGTVHLQPIRVMTTRPPLPDSAPSAFREVQRRGVPTRVWLAADVVQDILQLLRIQLAAAPPPRRRVLGRHEGVANGLHRWISAGLEAQRTVSLRWLPRWFEADLTLANLFGGRVRDPGRGGWVHRIVSLGPLALRRMDPWLDPDWEGSHHTAHGPPGERSSPIPTPP